MMDTPSTRPADIERQALLALRKLRKRLDDIETARREPFAIVGLGCRFPGADGPEAYWNVLASGCDVVTQIPAERWNSGSVFGRDAAMLQHAGVLDDVEHFDADFFGITGREALLLDPQQRLILEVVWEALEHAGIPATGLRGSDTGVFVGMTTTDYLRVITRRMRTAELDAYVAPGNTLNSAAGRVSYLLGLHGPCIAMDTACSSSLVAVDRACRSLRDDECRLAIAAGVNLLLAPEFLASLSRWGMLAADGRCKTFDASANGFVRAEGCGVVLLKRLSHAQADGDRIWALVRGSAINQDGPSSGLTVPNGLAQAAVIRAATANAGVEPRSVSYVEAHGTGTTLGDPIEMEALTTVYGADRDSSHPLRVGAAKTNLGHLEAASGIAGVIKTVLALQHRQIPPNVHFANPTPHIPWDKIAVQIPTRLEEWEPLDGKRLAGISAFGFSGTNAHAVLEEAPPQEAPSIDLTAPHLLTLSARSPFALGALARRFAERVAPLGADELSALCYSASSSRSHLPYRLAARADDATTLASRLCAAAEALIAEPSPGNMVEGVVHGRVGPGGRPGVAFLFTGQGSQYAGMGCTLAAADSTFRAALQRCASLMDPLLDRPLLDGIHSAPGDGALDQTGMTQPAIFAIQWALAEAWKARGLTPDVVMGHSVGEYAAACVAGVLTLEDAARLVAIRGSLMQALPAGGAMAAVFAMETAVRDSIAKVGGEVEIAGVNGVQECVVSGRSDAVAGLMKRLSSEGIRSEALSVSHAFHSSLMAPMLGAFAREVRGIVRAPPRCRVISTVTGEAADADWASADYWTSQLRLPVRYLDGIRAAIQGSVGIALEIGPHPVLAGLGQRALPDAAVCWLPSLRRARDERVTMDTTTAELYVRGAVNDWSGSIGASLRGRVAMPTYQFQRTRFWVDAPAEGDGPIRLDGSASPASPAKLGSAADWRHPLLGARLDLATDDIVYHAEAGNASHGSLRDHRLQGQVVWPATAVIEMALAAGRDNFGDDGSIEVNGVNFVTPLLLAEEHGTPVQTVLRKTAKGRLAAEMFATGASSKSWNGFATVAGIQRETRSKPALEAARPWADAASRCASQTEPADAYAGFARRGIEFGPAFQTLDEIRIGSGEAVGRLRLANSDTLSSVWLHPALLDGCLQLGFLAAGEASQGPHDLLVPRSVDRLTLFAAADRSIWCHAIVSKSTEPSAALRLDLVLWNEDGRCVARVEGVHLAAVPKIGFGNEPADMPRHDLLASAGYRIAWPAIKLTTAGPSSTRAGKRWAVLSDDAEFSASLCAALVADGDACVVDPLRSIAPGWLDSAAPRLGGNPTHIIFVSATGAGTSDPADVVQEAVSQLDLAAGLVRVCAKAAEPVARLWLLTRNAQSVLRDEAPSLAAAALWGFGRVAQSEHPELHCSLLDLQADSDVGAVCGVLRSASLDQTQLALRGASVHSARLEALQPDDVMRIAVPQLGEIDSISIARTARVRPGAGEIQIDVRSAGLNFRDVLCALGLYPGVVGALGGECAGVVGMVGAGVTEFAPGDEVLAFAPGSLATSSVVSAAFAARKPDNLSFEQAAGLPIACMTASYALENLARLKPGQRILIHAAAGGVGLAAVQLALMLGAEVYATAGSDAKRDMLRKLGVKHVHDSRSLAFRDEVMSLTSGAGVDVVLNSLSGVFIQAGVETLGRHGCFIEIGKRGILSAEAMRTIRDDVRYLPFDLGDEVRRSPVLATELLNLLMRRIKSGELTPLPITSFPMSAPHEAFRLMAQARHIGKIVLRQDMQEVPGRRAVPVRVQADATYLVTGGLGYLGMLAARDLVDRGARHVELLGRTAATGPELAASINMMRESGALVRTASVDLSDGAALRDLVDDIERTMPPIRGVVHAAGVLDDATIEHLGAERFDRVMRPKLLGALHLSALTAHLPLDFFVAFSAAAAWLGPAGQANYAAANAALDAFAQVRHATGRPTLSIAWGRWQGGMAAGQADTNWEKRGISAVAPSGGFAALFDLLDLDLASAAVMPVDWSRYAGSGGSGRDDTSEFLATVRSVTRKAETGTVGAKGRLADLIAVPSDQRRGALGAMLESVLRHIIGLPASQVVDPRTPLRDLGMDSLMTVELRNAIGRTFERTFPATLVFDYPTLDAITNHLMETLPGLRMEPASQDAAATIRSVKTPVSFETVRQIDALSEEEAEALLLQELSAKGAA
jgi:acyl transferase domain-containing protein/NADPH:quinone reductase-like Zn-dependent oxidoreductase/NADP-dependent 3-hydroxy acid dehydrogenase YdfG/acyl carrier protein